MKLVLKFSQKKKKEGKTMSNRTYLQFKQYKDDEEMNRIHKLAFNKMKDYVDDNLFDDWEWRDECIHFNKTIEIYSSELTENLIKNNPNFIPNEVIDNFHREIGRELIYKNGEDDTEGVRVVALSKENILQLIQDCHQEIANIYKDMLKMTENPLGIEALQIRLKNKIKEWEGVASNDLVLYKDGKMDVPFPLGYSYEYLIIQLVEIINQYDWDHVDVILFNY